ncbi:FMN reductase [Rhizobium sp. C1]|uniref:FMN reductase n=1 Tax=Rhizobium sp. C1 TaxID=1349799 RepID=UPI001E4A59B0|nr:FMN reductase [Rhizobium sp. C1]MCD2177922.1 FMN reductase [Rhizobium sp. C1]
MSGPAIVGFAGSASIPSKTRLLVEKIVSSAADRFDETSEVYDILDFAASLGTARKIDDLDVKARVALDAILNARALVIATPVYKGSYPGLFKHLIDLLDPSALTGKPILLAATGGGEKHALVIEHQLRPLFAFFEAQTLATGVYASDRDFEDGVLRNPLVLDRIERAVGHFGPLIGAARDGDVRAAVSTLKQVWPAAEAAAASR